MSRFDEEPDGDPHGECALEIHRLEARIAELEAECERLRVNANIGSVVWKYIDRMGDVVPSDPAARILCEFYHAVLPVIGAAKESA